MVHRSPHPDIVVQNLSLYDMVFSAAQARGDAPAMADGLTGRVITYGQLIDRIRRTAAGLASRGIGKGDVVSIWAPNLPEWPIAFFAAIRVGATVHTSNPVSTPEEMSYQLSDAGSRLLITVNALSEKAREAIAESGRSLEIVTLDDSPFPTLASLMIDAPLPAVDIDPASDVAVLPYSSGTTGLPKGVMLTHRNIVAQLAQLDVAETSHMPAMLGVLPFFHIYGMVVILMLGLMRGVTIVALHKFEFEPFLKVLRGWPITVAHVVPPMAVALAKHPLVDNYQFPHLQCLFSAAAPMGPELTAAVEERLKVKVRQGYGMTEASPGTHYALPGHEHIGTVGPLLPNTECRIVDPESGANVPVGERGEVWVRGPQVMKGYLNNPEATAKTVDADGWLHTGDIGIVDERGDLTVVDRLKELIKVKGFQVAPAELESLLLKHPRIADVAVIPIPDEESGELPKAVLVAKGPLTADEVAEFLLPHVAHYKRIRHVEFVDAIPKSPSGKILRRVLVEKERIARA